LRIAIVSDIHANLAAFESVLAHAKAIGYDRMVCLGDVVGYGPDPVECVDLVRQHCEWALLGNHDFAALYEPTNFNPGAAKAVFWTRSQTVEGEWLRRHVAELQLARDEDRISDTEFLDKKCAAEVEQRERVDFMFRISPRRILLDRYICVHASPSRPVNEYLSSRRRRIRSRSRASRQRSPRRPPRRPTERFPEPRCSRAPSAAFRATTSSRVSPSARTSGRRATTRCRRVVGSS
jgi:hypothetical protein